MAKVVLVWNEHPTEVVAGFHARKVAKILKERYGHEVIVEKIPVKETDYGILMREPVPEVWDKLEQLEPSSTIAAKHARKHGAFAFNFHASPEAAMGQAETIPPGEFRVGVRKSSHKPPFRDVELVFLPNRGKSFLIEMPGVFIDLPRHTHGRLIDKILDNPNGRYEKDILKLLISKAGAMNLRIPQQQKYLHPAISEKIAAAIHERITIK